VGQGRGAHVYLDDELGKLAGMVVSKIHPNRSDRESRADCWQEAYAAGLQALGSAVRSRSRSSHFFLKLAMQSAVYRALRRARRGIRESDLQFDA